MQAKEELERKYSNVEEDLKVRIFRYPLTSMGGTYFSRIVGRVEAHWPSKLINLSNRRVILFWGGRGFVEPSNVTKSGVGAGF